MNIDNRLKAYNGLKEERVNADSIVELKKTLKSIALKIRDGLATQRDYRIRALANTMLGRR